MARVFVSHAGADTAIAVRVHHWLVDEGHEVFLDHDLADGIRVGDDWAQRLHERLRWADAVVCVVTPAYVDSTWCGIEVGVAQGRGCLLLPLAAATGVIHPLLTTVQHIDLADENRARRALAAELLRVGAAGGVGWLDGTSPFPGLVPFEAELRHAFFGRSGDVRRLLEVLRSPAARAERQVLLVVGPSGCGKSSLVRAGLVPAVAEERGWATVAPFVPGVDPVGALAAALATAAEPLGLGWAEAGVRDRLGTAGLAAVVGELLAATSPRARRLLLVVDQFEELLAPDAVAERRARLAERRVEFVGLLTAALDGPVQVVVTVRPEFLDGFLSLPELAALPTRPETVRPLQREALRAVVEEPCRLAGIRIDRDLVTELVDDTADGEALPLLAYTLAELADGVGRGGELSAQRYRQLGGVQGALVRQADEALAAAVRTGGRGPDDVVNELLHLVAVDEQNRPMRTRVRRSDLVPEAATELDAFVTRRLLTTDTDAGDPVIGVAHERFITTWRPLARAIEGSAAALRAARTVERDARDWDGAGRTGERLWARGQIDAALDQLRARIVPAPRARGLARPREVRAGRVAISPTAEAFLVAGVRQDRLRRGRVTAVLSALLALAVAAGIVAVVQLGTAREQQAVATGRQLVAQAETIRASDPRTALMLDIAAERVHSDPRTRSALVGDLLSTRYAGTLAGHTGAVAAPLFSADGTLMVTGGIDGTVILWDLTGARPVPIGNPLTADPELVGVRALATDTRTLATSRGDESIVLWDLHDPAAPRMRATPIPAEPARHQFAGLAFSPDGRLLAVGRSYPATVTLWDVSDPDEPRPLGDPLALGTSLALLAFAGDGALVTAQHDDEYNSTATVWDLGAPQTPRPVDAPIPYDSVAAFDQRTGLLAVDDPAGFYAPVHLWDLTDPLAPRRLPGTVGSGSTNVVAFSPDGSRFALVDSSRGQTVRIWDISDRERPHPIEEPPEVTAGGGAYPIGSGITLDQQITALEFLPGRAVLATVSGDDRVVTLWDYTDPTAPAPVGDPIAGASGQWPTVAFLPGGRTLLTSRSDGTMLLWDLTDPGQAHRTGTGLTGAKPVTELAFLPDAASLAVGYSDGTVETHDLHDPARPGPARPVAPARTDNARPRFAPATGLLAVRDPAAGVVVSDLRDPSRTGRIAAPFVPGEGKPELPEPLGFSPDGRTLAVGLTSWGSRVSLWDVGDPTHPRLLGQPMDPLGFLAITAFSPDGHLLASVVGADAAPGVALIDVSAPERPWPVGHPLTGHTDSVRTVAFSPDGHLLATGSTDRTVQVWDVADPAAPHRLGLPLTGHADAVVSLAFSPDGRTLASGADDGQVFLWNLDDLDQPRRLGQPLTANTRIAGALLFSADGRLLITGDADGHTVVWDLAGLAALRADPHAAACARVGRGLDETEWQRYLGDVDYRDTCA